MSDVHAPGPDLPPHQGHRRPAELLDRFLAKLIDYAVVFVVSMLIGIFFAIGVAFGSGSNYAANVITTLITTALVLGYFTLMESSRGQTVGKMALRLRVVAPGGGNPTTEQALKRNIWMAVSLLGILPFIGWLLQGIAWVAAVVTIALGINNDTVKRQAWHDRLGGDTQVVKEV